MDMLTFQVHLYCSCKFKMCAKKKKKTTIQMIYMTEKINELSLNFPPPIQMRWRVSS